MASNIQIISELKNKFYLCMHSSSSTKLILKRLFQNYVLKHRIKLSFSIICMIVVAATTATNAWLMQPNIDDIFINKNATLLFIIQLQYSQLH